MRNLVPLLTFGLIALAVGLMLLRREALGPADATRLDAPAYRVTRVIDGKPTRDVTFLLDPRLDLTVPDEHTAFLVEPLPAVVVANRAPTLWERTTPARFAAPERRLAEFLLLLPVGTLVVCFLRNVVGLTTFGTFAPALLGLAFRDIPSIGGFFLLGIILAAGWFVRAGLQPLQLLPTPRAGVLLGILVIGLFAVLCGGQAAGLPAASWMSPYPLVILVGMIERFWATDEQDGPDASLRTLFETLIAATIVGATVAWPMVRHGLIAYPEAVLFPIAGQLALGRYAGFRLTELYRFRDLTER